MVRRHVVANASGGREFLGLLLCTDALLIALHLAHTFTPYFSDVRYSVEMERGFGEIVQYVKALWIALSFLWLAVRTAEWAYLAWSPLFAYLLVDDSFELHEKLGVRLAERFELGSVAGLRPIDAGEIIVFAAIGAATVLTIGVAYRLGSPGFRHVSRRLLALLALFVFFAVAVDMTHAALLGRQWVERLLTALEDGGEMLAMSAMCAYAVGLLLRGEPRAPAPG